MLIPVINDNFIAETAKAVKEAGALIYNIIPLIPQNGFKDIPAPTCIQLEKARQDAEPYINIFRRCAHCRADAVGVPGVYDIGTQIYMNRINIKETYSHGWLQNSSSKFRRSDN